MAPFFLIASFDTDDLEGSHSPISTRFRISSRTHVYALQFEELSEENDLIRRAYQRPNMIVMGPDTGIIGARRAAWAPVECPAFMEVAFELRADNSSEDGEGAENEEAKLGLMKIGDFRSFCDFLESMTAV